VKRFAAGLAALGLGATTSIAQIAPASVAPVTANTMPSR
jgi:hypothetical protein